MSISDFPSETFEVFPWSANFETGIALVDQQHRQLVQLLNKLAGHLGHRASPVELDAVFHELAAYADYHFTAEEAVWAPVFGDDAWYLAHLRGHQAFLQQALEIKAKEATLPLDEVVEELLRYLTHWLAFHILDSDKRMAKVVRGVEVGLPLEEAKQRADEAMSGSMQVLIETVLGMYDALSTRTLDLMRERTERLKLEQELRARELRERTFSDSVINSVPGLLYLLDEELRLVRWNHRLSEALGGPGAELRGRSFLDFFDDGGAERIAAAFGPSVGQPYLEVEEHLIGPDGGRVPYLFTAVSMEIGEERFKAGIAIDLSRRAAAESALLRLSAAVEQVAESIVITDLRGDIEYVNPAFERVSGYTRDEVVGNNPRILKSDVQDTATYQRMWNTLLAGEVWQGRLINRKKCGGLYPEDSTISPMRDSSGAIDGFVAVKRDVTKELELERSVREAQKLNAIGSLAGGIAHDLNNILIPILTYASLARGNPALDDETCEYLDEIGAAGERARSLVQQILSFSRRTEKAYGVLALGEVVQEAVGLMRSTLPSTVHISSRIDPGAGCVVGDATQVHQVVVNLCTNATYAMRERGGSLEIALDPVGEAEARYVCLTVRDTGVGMGQDTLERLFDPFYTTKPEGEGTGLGLSVVQGIVQSHRGYLEVESELGQGSTFRVFLPRSASPEEARAAMVEQALIQGLRVLLVDDEPDALRAVERILIHLGCEVLAVSDPAQGLARFRAEPEGFDLVLCDVTMPGMTGDALATALLAVRPALPVLLMTGYSATVDQEVAARLGVRALLNKPLTPAELQAALSEALSSALPTGR